MKSKLYIPQSGLSYSTPYNLMLKSENTLINKAKLSGVIIVDTGCSITSFGVADQFTKEQLILFKKKDISLFRQKKVHAFRTYGVHDEILVKKYKLSKKNNLSLCSNQELLEDPRISFMHKTDSLYIGGVNFGPVSFGINYNRHGHSLLGVNFLKDFSVEIIPLDQESYLKIASINKDGLLSKVRLGLKKQLLISEIVESLTKEGYEKSDINSALVEVLKDTYATPGTID